MSPSTQFCISWDSYKNNMILGFSRLQQKEEFVDMTLAAEGHFVKVHKNVVALASPYLKEILQSTVCQHPVIFLSHISQKVLSYILEYIYTGEVQVPTDDMNAFIEACKCLHLAGVENIGPKNVITSSNNNQLHLTKSEEPINEHNNYVAHITINDVNDLDVQHFGNDQLLDNIDESMKEVTSDKYTQLPRYSTSNRGSLQLILNGYIYYNHHIANKGRKRRWRCIDYRTIQCPAFIDTDDEVIVNRECLHRHPSHRNKILKKANQNLIFTSITKATEQDSV
ncbi:broad-complex core protein isoforms 1/2/3/4/5-like isoform X3 [Galleria mellonella]|uniref:Broad-complex core protein isoforms 1/2/3/4/5-like isoform X3 n=1 Tax=Galleria mellonella TaxID=7137 RepID=A0ABM3MXJ9_GALME|nr:broad-complex core protein isoforms 1/2/3/4/5-like isoform X3 [Galleria mellonella]